MIGLPVNFFRCSFEQIGTIDEDKTIKSLALLDITLDRWTGIR